jgi:hypothetical protein
MTGQRAGFLLIAAPAVILGAMLTSGMRLAALRASANTRAQASAPRAGQAGRPAAKPLAATPHERFATFLAGEGFQSVFLLENFRVDVPVTVTPALILRTGEVSLDPVTIPAHSMTSVDISAFLVAHGYQDTRGTAVMHYDFTPYDPITGVVLSSDYAHHLYINSYAQSPEEYWQGTSYDATLWAPDEDTQGSLAIINTSNEERVVHATFLVKGRAEEQAITVPARHTHVLSIDDLVTRSRETGAGIHIEYSEYPGEILVEGHLYNQRTGFEKYIHFLDKTLKYATGMVRTQFLLLGQQPLEDDFPAGMAFRSVAAVRNIDTAPVQVTPTVKFLQGRTMQAVALRPVVLGVNESRIIDFNEEQEAGRLPRDLHQGSLELDPHTDHASIVAELFDFSDRTGGYAIGPFFFAYPTRATGSIWRIDGTYQTTLMVENAAAKDDRVTLKLFFGSKVYSKTYAVGAGDLLKINVKELQQDNVPDDEGHFLAATSGLVSLSGKNGHLSKLSFDKLIHSLDESDYVGLPGGGGGGGGGCYTETAGLFVDFSGGQNPYPVMLQYNWADGSFQDQPASGTVADNPSVFAISNDGAGDMATITPDGQSHEVFFNGPPTTVTDCPACSTDNVTPQGHVTVPPAPTVTIDSFTPNPIVGGSTASVRITVTPSANITLTISQSGTGTATFGSSGKTTIQIPETTTVNITGGAESNGSADLTLSASSGSALLATAPFSVTTGTCTATYTSHNGDGTKNCPTQVNVSDTYSMKEYCSACQFACTFTFDSTFTPSSCNGVSIGVQGAGNSGLITTLTGNFAATDCDFHFVQITTTVTDTQGVKTPYTGGAIGLKCNKFPNGSPCP